MVQIIALALGCLFIRLMFPENALVGVAVDLQHRCALCSLLNDVVTGDGDILACSEASRALSLVWSRMAPGRFVAADLWWATRGQTRSMPDSCALRAAAVGRQSPLRSYSKRSELFVLHKDYITVRWADVFSSVRGRNGHLRGRASLVGDVSRRVVGRVKPEGTVVESIGDRWDRV